MSTNHKHNHSELKGKKLGLTIVLNIIITVSQVFGGLISGSLSLLSDALHNFSDVVSLMISYIATILSKRRNTVDKTFGYKRAEILAAFINASTLIIIAIFLGIEAIDRFRNPKTIASIWVIALALLSILLNGLSVLILKKDARDSMNIKSAYLHLLTDMFTSVAVLLGGIFMYYFNIYWIDGVLTLLIAVYLIYMTWSLLIDSLKILMLFTPSNIVIEDISNRICSISHVQNIHHVHVWQLYDKDLHFEAHVDLKKNLTLIEVNKVFSDIRKMLLDEFNIGHVTLQPEFNSCNEKDLVIK